MDPHIRKQFKSIIDANVSLIDSLTRTLYKASHELRERLEIDEGTYNCTKGSNSPNAKAYYLYGVLNDVEKAILSIITHHEFVNDSKSTTPPGDNGENRLDNNIIQFHIDELAVGIRKMTESLIDLIGFRGADKKEYYVHYHLVHDLNDLIKIKNDFDTYYACQNKNLNNQIAILEQEIIQNAPLLSSLKCWYVKKKKGVLKKSPSTTEERFKQTFKLRKHGQITILQTYGSSFGKPSDLLHPSKTSRRAVEPLILNDIDTYIMRLIVFVSHVLSAIKDLMHIHNVDGCLKEIVDITKKNCYSKLLSTHKRKHDISVFDYVLAYGELAQVIKVIRSPYGYKTFRVKYLEPQRGSLIAEDDFAAPYIRLLYKQKALAESTKLLLSTSSGNKTPSTKALNIAVKKSLLQSWLKLGLKEAIDNDKNGAIKKIEGYLNRTKKIKTN